MLGNQSDTPELHSLDVTQSVYGIVIPIVAGTVRATGNVLWYGDFNTNGTAYNLGGSGLGKSSEYDYQCAVLFCLCHGPVVGIGSVWGDNGRLNLNSTSEQYTVPAEGGNYVVANASAFNSDYGVAQLTPYSLEANDYGSPGPVVLAGTQATPLPASAYSQNNGTYSFGPEYAGTTVIISYSFSLYVVEASEDYIIPNTSPFEITVVNQPLWRSTVSVIFVDTGVALTPVDTYPTQSGTYWGGVAGGDYYFYSGDSERPVVINYTWRQSDSELNTTATLAFDLLEGTQSQSPWAYLTSNHLSQAFGYSTIALIGVSAMDLGPSGQLPNYNYEIQGPFQFGAGIVDADTAVWIQEFLTNEVWGCQLPSERIDSSLGAIARDYWNSNSYFISVLLNAADSASELIDKWCEAGNTEAFWSEGVMKFAPYGDTTMVGNGFQFTPQTSPIVDLNFLDFIADGDDDPVQVTRTPFQDAYNEVKVQFTNRINNYNNETVVEQDNYAIALYGLRPEGQRDYDFITTIGAATFAANIALKRLVYIRAKYQFKISGIRYQFLEPMDMVTLTDEVEGLNYTPVRILEISEDENRIYDVTAEEFPWGTATATIYPKQPTQPAPPQPYLTQPGNTIVSDMFEPPDRVAVAVANSGNQIWAALTGGPNWGGCLVYFSVDNQAFTYIGTQTGTSRAGTLTADLPYEASNPDTTSTLAVSTTGQLFNVSQAAVNAYATISVVNGSEYLAYMNATLTGVDGQQNAYNLSYLERGLFSTPVLAAPEGSTFVRCDAQLFQYSYDPSLAGTTVYFKFLSFNLMNQMQQGLADVNSYPFTISGANLSTNMTVDSVVDGQTATIRIYQQGQAVGTAGSATLTNGAVVTLPADSQTGEQLNTQYYVNFNPTAGAYVFYTDQNQWLLDEIYSGYLRIGSVLTGNNWIIIPLTGGGTVAISVGAGVANGSAVPLPPGYSTANLLTWTTAGAGYSSEQLSGILYSTATSGVLNAHWENRSHGDAGPTTSNYVAVAWSAGAAVTLSQQDYQSGSFNILEFTTALGDPIAIVFGTQTDLNAIPVPSGYSSSEFLSIQGMATTYETGNTLTNMQCSFTGPGSGAGPMYLTARYLDFNQGVWGGLANVLALFWKTGGGIASQSVTGGTAITIPLTSGASATSATIVGAIVNSGSSFGFPSGYTLLDATASVSGIINFSRSDIYVSHGMQSLSCTGMVFNGIFENSLGNTWPCIGNVLAIGYNS